MGKQSKKENPFNEPEIPGLTLFEELQLDNLQLASIISKIKYFFPMAKKYLTEQDLEMIRKYAK